MNETLKLSDPETVPLSTARFATALFFSRF